MKFLLAAILCFVATIVRAEQIVTGNELHSFCLQNRSAVEGYVLGWLDKRAVDQDFIGLTLKIKPEDQETKGQLESVSGGFCLPSGVKISQVADILCDYVNIHPASRNYGASWQINEALNAVWPCS